MRDRFDIDQVIKITGLGINADQADGGADFDVACQIAVKKLWKIKEYEFLEEQGKLLKLPCAVGDTVYYLDRFCSGSLDCPSRPCESCEDYQLEIYEGKFKLNDINDFGKTVFLTREEAEAALKELEG